MILRVPVWVIGTIVYLALIVWAVISAKREGESSDMGFGCLIVFFTLPLITILYLIFLVVLLVVR